MGLASKERERECFFFFFGYRVACLPKTKKILKKRGRWKQSTNDTSTCEFAIIQIFLIDVYRYKRQKKKKKETKNIDVW